MRKTFGPHDDPPSRADSFVGGPWYDDSYRTQDSRRAGLPVSMLPNFAAAVAASAAANGGAAAAGATTGSVPNSVPHAGRGPVPSVVNMFFPDGSVRGGAAGSSRGGPPGSSAYGRSGSAGVSSQWGWSQWGQALRLVGRLSLLRLDVWRSFKSSCVGC
jgi:hypothetical protein